MPDPTTESTAERPSNWWPVRVAFALALAALAFLPISNWIPDGYADPDYRVLLDEWTSGSVVIVGVALVLAILSRRVPALWRDGAARRLADRLWARWWSYAAVLALATLALSALVATLVFRRAPSIIDEIAQLFQARIYAAGHLSLPVGEHPEFFSTLHTVTRNGRVFSQFPPGGPFMLALGVLAGAPWLVDPIVAALTVLCWAWALRHAEPERPVAVLALPLFALSPFLVFMSGSYMNHVTTLAWLVVACAGLAALTARDHEPDAPLRPGIGFLTGLGLGVAATIRPVDALAFAAPAGLWILVRALKSPRRWAEAIPSGVGVALPILAMMWVHVHTTGKPLLFGYELLWGKEHGLGFHMAPWGIPHTPARGLELLNLYFSYLQGSLFQTSLPGLLPALVALALVPRLRPFDRYLLASGLLLSLCYWAYWHNGFFLGPRFIYPLLPVATWWTARALPILRRRIRGFTPDSLPYRATAYALMVAVALGVVASLPAQVRLYASRFKTERWDVRAAARQAGITTALVIVPETWESQFAVRMRALGVSAQAAEKTYRAVDACRLENTLLDLEARGVTGDSATRVLFSLLPDSVHVQNVELKSQAHVRVRQGSNWTPRCLRLLRENQRGAIALAPFLHSPVPGLTFARDLHERDTVLFRMYPNRPVWVLRPDDGTLAGAPVLHRAPVDSLLRAWAAMR